MEFDVYSFGQRLDRVADLARDTEALVCAGSSEIQRNTIGERVLGLPRE